MCRTTTGEIAKTVVLLAPGHCNCITGTDRWRRVDGNPSSLLYKHEVMLMESRDVIEEYLAAIETVRAAFGYMSRELLFARPVAGKWSSQ